jgi:hypothetical protein
MNETQQEPRINGYASPSRVDSPQRPTHPESPTHRVDSPSPESPNRLTGRISDAALTYGFYATVLAVALTGATQAMTHRLGWEVIPAAVACGSVELGGVLFSHHADSRRRLGESAIPSRLASAAVALGAVCVNYFGHSGEPFQAYFFAGMSILGYAAYLIKAGARYRDAMRKAEKMAQPAPAYSAVQWIRHPWITRQARIYAIQDPTLGAVKSLLKAQDAERVATRNAAVADVIQDQIAARLDSAFADIVVKTYDMGKVAEVLVSEADYLTLARIISSQLTPERIAPVPEPPHPESSRGRVIDSTVTESRGDSPEATHRVESDPKASRVSASGGASQPSRVAAPSRITDSPEATHKPDPADPPSRVGESRRIDSPTIGPVPDEVVTRAIRHYVVESIQSGSEPGQRAMVRLVEESTGTKVGQKRCVRIANEIRDSLSHGESTSAEEIAE